MAKRLQYECTQTGTMYDKNDPQLWGRGTPPTSPAAAALAVELGADGNAIDVNAKMRLRIVDVADEAAEKEDA